MYTEIIRGFVGAHSIKSLPNGDLYFCDSCNGNIVQIDFSGNVKKRYKTNSNWLQDCVWIQDEIYFCSSADLNLFELWDFDKNKLIWQIDGSVFGETAAFINISP